MKHPDHVNLLRPAVVKGTGPWADFGSGEGAFTLALRELLGPGIEIFSIEKDEARLDQQQRSFLVQFPESNIHFIHADFMCPLDLPLLDGLVIANALHFFRDKERVLRTLRSFLKDDGRLVVVEYDVDSGNPWVPYPISFDSLRPITLRAGMTEPRRVAAAPSRFLGQIYSALAFKSPDRARPAKEP